MFRIEKKKMSRSSGLNMSLNRKKCVLFMIESKENCRKKLFFSLKQIDLISECILNRKAGKKVSPALLSIRKMPTLEKWLEGYPEKFVTDAI